MSETVQELLRSMKITAGSRFNACKRLESLDRRLTAFTAMSSAFVIGLTILPYFVSLPKEVSDYLNLATVVLSVVVLVSSLLQYSSSNTVKAEQYHRSALEINELRRELKFQEPTISDEDFLKISREYSAVLQKYSINHEDIDFFRYQLERLEDFPTLMLRKRSVMHVQQWISRGIPNVYFLLLLAFFIWLVFFYALPTAGKKGDAGSAACQNQTRVC